MHIEVYSIPVQYCSSPEEVEKETATLALAICTVNGEFVRRIQLDEVRIVYGITVTVESHIGVAFEDKHHTVKVIVV